jgi:DNA-binding transcriptional regulator YdaS (Cro superfamily)
MSEIEPHFRALVRSAVEIVGSQGSLAQMMGRSQQQVSALINRAPAISAEDAVAIHRATNGQVPASALRPDLWLRPEDVPAVLHAGAA